MPDRATSLPDFDICIAGSGPVGLTLALALAQTGLSTAVVTRNAATRQASAPDDARAYSIALGCWRMWETLGVASQMAPHAQPVTALAAEGGGAHPAIFDVSDLHEAGDPLGYMIAASRIDAALSAAVEQTPGITVIPSAAIDAMEHAADRTIVSGPGLSPLPARIVVGCDGRNSAIRRLAGVKLFTRDYKASGVVATVDLVRAHNGVARQKFLPSGPLAVLPLPKDRANIVWSVPTETARTLVAMGDADFSAELADQAGDFIGPFALCGPRLSYPLVLQIAESMVSGPVALAGDAAHAVHPLAGQGLNLGLKDVAALAEVLGETARVGLDIRSSTALETYARWRRADVVASAMAMDGLERLFHGPAALRGLAGLGMSLTNQSPTLRQFFTREAGGLTGDLPRLFRGLSLSPG